MDGFTDRVGGDKAWEDILDEYSGMMSVGKNGEALDLYNKIGFCEWRLMAVDCCTNTLRDFYVVAAAETLANAGFDYVQNLEDEADYQCQIDMIINESSSVFVTLNQLKAQYEKQYPRAEQEVKKRTALDFDKELAILAKHGYKVDKRTQTVTEYCAAVNAFFDEVKMSKRHGK